MKFIYLYTDYHDEYEPIHAIVNAPKAIYLTKNEAEKYYKNKSQHGTATIFEIDLELMSIKAIWHDGEDI